MPRMSKKRKLEWAFFLNHRNRITYNDLCRKCVNGCKQSFRAVVVDCPRYISKRATRKNRGTVCAFHLVDGGLFLWRRSL
jgi:hypothetical protein